jgi:hypothetical protein
MTWVQQRDPSKEILCYGTGLGYLAFWRHGVQRKFDELVARRVRTGAEILALAFDVCSADSVRIALGARDGLVMVLRLDSHAQLHGVFSVQLNGTVPKTVAFAGNAEGDVYVFSIYDGRMCVSFNVYLVDSDDFASHTLNGNDGKLITTFHTNKIL